MVNDVVTTAGGRTGAAARVDALVVVSEAIVAFFAVADDAVAAMGQGAGHPAPGLGLVTIGEAVVAVFPFVNDPIATVGHQAIRPAGIREHPAVTLTLVAHLIGVDDAVAACCQFTRLATRAWPIVVVIAAVVTVFSTVDHAIATT